MRELLRIGLTLGHPGGIGPEVTAAALARRPVWRHARVRVFVAAEAVDLWLGLVRAAGLPEPGGGGPGGLELAIAAGSGPALPAPVPGRRTAGDARLAMRAVAALADAACAGELDAMLTGPVSKEIFAELDPPPPGHTEYLAGRFATDTFAMMLGGPRLRVVPVTTHLPLREVAGRLSSQAILRTGLAAARALREWLGSSSPRLAVAALNPHAGEGGRFGDEEATIIEPALALLRGAGVEASGPHPADTVFAGALAGRFDAVLCMYHDQALGPFKTVHFADGWNLTCGLPVPRVSPAHGTAFDLAGTGRADPKSTIAALDLALGIAQTRRRRGRGQRRDRP